MQGRARLRASTTSVRRPPSRLPQQVQQRRGILAERGRGVVAGGKVLGRGLRPAHLYYFDQDTIR